ncbi:MAG TPA: hypothetical protein VFJ62_01250, partial [Usitatibacter sp.]|nr:hypothetical protein [Usitatibacter sp.]
MVPFHADDPGWRPLLGTAIPLLLPLLLAAAQGNSQTAAVRPLPQAVTRAAAHDARQVFPSPAFPAFDEDDNLRVYLARARPYLDDPRTMYYVSQALEECYEWGAEPDHDAIYAGVEHVSHVDLQEAKRSWAAEALAAPCR